MKTSTKKTTKKAKPTFTVDLTNAETPEDIKWAFISAKLENDVPLNKWDINFLIRESVAVGVGLTLDIIVANSKVVDDVDKIEKIKEIVEKPEKKPWYKRFWNWITRKK